MYDMGKYVLYHKEHTVVQKTGVNEIASGGKFVCRLHSTLGDHGMIQDKVLTTIYTVQTACGCIMQYCTAV